MNSPQELTRRHWLAAGLGAAAAAGTVRAADIAPSTSTTGRIPMRPPRTEFVYEAIVDISPVLEMGKSPLGERRMVPITGGSFEGPGLRGKVLSGGADRQLWRADGVRHLDAVYELQTDDGALISVRNRVLVKGQGALRYAISHIQITAPEGPYGWLNDLVYVGTLDSLRPERQAVVVRVFKLV